MNFQSILNIISLWALPFIIVLILTVGILKKIPVYEIFTDGAKDGFKVAVNIIPYLVAIIVAISMFRASGAIEMAANSMSFILSRLNIPVDVLPVILVRPLSGSAALGLFSEIATNAGAGAYSTKLAAVMVGSSETTFYVLSVYFGSVGIRKFRYALGVGILADIIAAIMSIIVCNWMFK
jgi:spore maturation protein B